MVCGGYRCTGKEYSEIISNFDCKSYHIDSFEIVYAGINPGASLSLDGKTFNYGVMIPVSEINICLDEWNSQ